MRGHVVVTLPPPYLAHMRGGQGGVELKTRMGHRECMFIALEDLVARQGQ